MIFCQAKSGARLAWEFFHPNTPCPLLLQHIEDQDLWRFSLLDTKVFCAGLRLRNFEFEVYDRIVHSAPEDPEFGYNIVRNEGNAISRFLQQQVNRLSNSPNVVPLELPVPATGGTRIVRGLAVNCDALFASDLTLTPPSNTSRHKARSARCPARPRNQPCIYAGVGLSRA